MNIRFLSLLFLAIAPGLAHALGLGKLQLESALNEPLKARIELLGATTEDITSLNIGLADEAAFRRAGIPRDYVLRQLNFSLKESDAGPDYILVYSNDPIREPFLNFLLEVSWSNGRLYREYTVLLDPPVYITKEMRKKVLPPPVTTTGESALKSGAGMEITEEEQTVVHYPEYKLAQTPQTAPTITQPTRPVEYAGGDYGPVASGETLWSIARAMRPDSSVSIQQMMFALVRTNPEAFINGNINGLKRGYVLKAPDMAEVQTLDKAEAFAQAQLQNTMWEEARQAYAATPPVRAEGAPTQPEPDVSEPVVSMEKPAEEAMVTKPPVVAGQPELRLVAPGEEGKSATQGGPAEPGNEALTKELALAREALEALNLENAELKDKISESDMIVADLNRLITLKETELAALQQQIAKRNEKPVEPGTPAATKPHVKETPPQKPVATTPAEKPAPPKPVKTEEPSVITSIVSSVMDVTAGLAAQVKNNLLYIAGALGVVVLVFIGANFVQRRRQAGAVQVPHDTYADFGEEPTVAVDAEDSTDMNLGGAGMQVHREAITIQPEQVPESTQMPTASGAPSAQEAVPVEAADPLEEVNVFLAYEHFDQAEEFVKNALDKEPDNLAYHVKLLEVYYTANNKKSYEQAARVLHDKVQGTGDYWNMAVAMWQVLSPNRALFAAPAAGEEAAEVPETKEAGGIVNITGDGESTSTGLDFDLDTTGGGAGAEESESLEAEAAAEPDILDVTAAISTSDNEILDVTSAVDTEEAVGEEAVAATSDDHALDFSLEPESKAAEEDDSLDISMDLLQEETAAPANTAESDNQGMDFSLDLDSKAAEEETSFEESVDHLQEETAAPAETPEGDNEALDFSLDLDSNATDEDKPLDASLNLLQEKSEAAAAESGGDDNQDLEFSLDLEASEQEETASSMDQEEPSSSVAESEMDVSHTGSALLDETSAIAAGEEKLDVSKSGRTTQSADLLDVTSATDFNPESGEDLLDVTFAGNVPTQGKDDDAALDFELAPDQPVPGEESSPAFDGIDLTAATGAPAKGLDLDVEASPVSAEDAFEMDMDATMQIPSMRSALMEKNEADSTLVVSRPSDGVQSDEDEIATQMDLAKAYIELGNADSAKTILNEIIAIGNDAQRQQAQELLGQIT